MFLVYRIIFFIKKVLFLVDFFQNAQSNSQHQCNFHSHSKSQVSMWINWNESEKNQEIDFTSFMSNTFTKCFTPLVVIRLFCRFKHLSVWTMIMSNNIDNKTNENLLDLFVKRY